MDRLAAWILRSIAGLMLIAAVAMLTASLAASGSLADAGVVRAIAGVITQIGVVFAVVGAAGLYLSVPRGLRMGNERVSTSDATRPPAGGWVIALALSLVALPVWLVIRLRPFLGEWRTVAEYLGSSRVWEGANANGAGLVLIPLAGALGPPLLELAAMAAFVLFSVMLLALLLPRNQHFPRLYLVSVVILSGLVIASARGAHAATLAGQGVEALINDSNPTAAEAAQLRHGLTRYTGTVTSTASVLVWTLIGYLLWIPPLLLSERARATFAGSDSTMPPAATDRRDVERITSPPRFPG